MSSRTRSPEHIEGLIEVYDSLSEQELAARWLPNKDVLYALLDARLRQIDRVAIIIAAYSADHGGATPPWVVVGDILGVEKSTAYGYGMRLASERVRRGQFKHSVFYLTESTYSHPLLEHIPHRNGKSKPNTD